MLRGGCVCVDRIWLVWMNNSDVCFIGYDVVFWDIIVVEEVV